MVTARHQCLVAAAILLVLAGCQREATVSPAATAASAPAPLIGAADDSPRALTDEVLARAGKNLPTETAAEVPVRVIETGPDEYRGPVRPETGRVFAPDADHRLLLVIGTRVDETGSLMDAGDTGRNLGLYTFTRTAGRWLLTQQNPSIARGGRWTTLDDLQFVDLGGGRLGLAPSYIECHTGTCVGTREVLVLGVQGVKRILSESVHYDTDGLSGPCDEMVKNMLAARSGGRTEFFGNELHCSLLEGRMRLLARGPQAWPDILFDFTGEEVSIDGISFEVKRNPVAQELLLRYQGDRYTRLSGCNPIDAAAGGGASCTAR